MTSIWAIGDLHLAFGAPEKSMEIFGSPWINYTEKIKKAWLNSVSPDDIVLIPGDISWAIKLDQAVKDFCWLEDLPGLKIMIRGNHDYWSSCSLKRINEFLPKNIIFLKNTEYILNDCLAVVGVKLGEDISINISSDIFSTMSKGNIEKTQNPLFERELTRLEISLKKVPKKIKNIIVMTHYPPLGTDFSPNQVTELLKKYNVNHCIFGHLHGIKKEISPYNNCSIEGVEYHFVSADYLNFSPLKILTL